MVSKKVYDMGQAVVESVSPEVSAFANIVIISVSHSTQIGRASFHEQELAERFRMSHIQHGSFAPGVCSVATRFRLWFDLRRQSKHAP